jgi:DNA-binding NarL/FixJ family response regulator
MTGKGVIVVDDDVLVREGVASLLSSAGFDVFGKAENGRMLARAIDGRVPELVVLDIRLSPASNAEGLVVARELRKDHPEIGILLLSAFVEIETALELLEDGERIGYLLKNRVAKGSELIDALERISEGECVIDPLLVQELFASRRRPDHLAPLTPRERDVLALMAEGRSNAGIAQRLSVTEGAVEKYVSRIFGKLRLSGTSEDHRRVLAVLTFLDPQ